MVLWPHKDFSLTQDEKRQHRLACQIWRSDN